MSGKFYTTRPPKFFRKGAASSYEIGITGIFFASGVALTPGVWNHREK